jgi:hypothetical protein
LGGEGEVEGGEGVLAGEKVEDEHDEIDEYQERYYLFHFPPKEANRISLF